MSSDRKVVMIDPKKADSLYEEAIKTLRTNLQFAGRGYRSFSPPAATPTRERATSPSSWPVRLEIWENAFYSWMRISGNPCW